VRERRRAGGEGDEVISNDPELSKVTEEAHALIRDVDRQRAWLSEAAEQYDTLAARFPHGSVIRLAIEAQVQEIIDVECELVGHRDGLQAEFDLL
jgi:hypothetical protein